MYVSRFPHIVTPLIFIFLVSVPQVGRWGGTSHAVGHCRPGGVRCHHEGLLPRCTSLCSSFLYDRQGFIWGGPLLEDEGTNPWSPDSVTRRYWVRQIKKKNCLYFLVICKPFMRFYVYGSVHRWSILIVFQWDATQSCLFIILQVHYTCFVCQPHSSSGVHKTVTTAPGTVRLSPSNVAKLVWPRWREVGAQKILPVPEAVVTVLCTLDDGCGWHSKHVQWTCRIINGLLCAASRWTIINIDPTGVFAMLILPKLVAFYM